MTSESPAQSPWIPVVIIGAGPAGLSSAYELQNRGIPSLILERDQHAGASWHRMPDNLRLASPWKANRLRGESTSTYPAHHALSRTEFASYLGDYARTHGLSIQPNTEVHDLIPHPERGFLLRTNLGDFNAWCVINATGYYSNPYLPSIPGIERTTIPRLHFAEYRSPTQVQTMMGGRQGHILLVGQRLSAGQLMLELVEAGHDISLSHRHPLKFGPGVAAWWVFFRVFPWTERLALLTRWGRHRRLEVRMPGGRPRRWIRQGRVGCFPAIETIDGSVVRFGNGEKLEPDLILFATGFRPALGHLASLRLTLDHATGLPALRGFASQDVSGLFFLGLEGQCTFRSRFLRGIREDAPQLAEVIRNRLQTVPPHPHAFVHCEGTSNSRPHLHPA